MILKNNKRTPTWTYTLLVMNKRYGQIYTYMNTNTYFYLDSDSDTSMSNVSSIDVHSIRISCIPLRYSGTDTVQILNI